MPCAPDGCKHALRAFCGQRSRRKPCIHALLNGSSRSSPNSCRRGRHRARVFSAVDPTTAHQASDWDPEEVDNGGAYPDITLLSDAEREAVLSWIPSAEQLRSLSGGPSRWLVNFGAACIVFAMGARNPVLQIAAFAFPIFFQDQLRACRNAGIWHATVLDLSTETRYLRSGATGEAQVPSQVLCMRIGEPGVDGFSSELEVPWSAWCQQLRQGDEVEVLVLSDSQYFESFQVVRDVYVPELQAWLYDYPFIKRDVFQRLSADVFRDRMASAEGGAARQEQPPAW